MPPRVLLDANGLKVSRPGENVETAATHRLLLWAGGTHLPVFVRGSAESGNRSQTDVFYPSGKTFPSSPFATHIVQVVTGSGTGTYLGMGGGRFMTGNISGDFLLGEVQFLTDRVRIIKDFAQNIIVNYTIWDYPIS